ncbi:MAG: hypothetical protein ACI3Y0_07225 [Prevotella sp.]
MKLNVFLSLIGVALASLLGYLAYNIADGQDNEIMCGICSTICFIATLIPTIGLVFESNKLGINVRVLSALFLIIFIVSHFCFAGYGVVMPYYIICNGIILAIYLAILYKISNIKSI